MTAPDAGISCPDCGRVFATFGNVTDIPCVPCAYKRLDAQQAAIQKLQAFKDFVHRTLDAMGVPVDPPGRHRDEGCRIGQRLEVIKDERDKMTDALQYYLMYADYGQRAKAALAGNGGA